MRVGRRTALRRRETRCWSRICVDRVRSGQRGETRVNFGAVPPARHPGVAHDPLSDERVQAAANLEDVADLFECDVRVTRDARPTDVVTRPSRSKMMSASRTGARLVSKRAAISTELIRAAGRQRTFDDRPSRANGRSKTRANRAEPIGPARASAGRGCCRRRRPPLQKPRRPIDRPPHVRGRRAVEAPAFFGLPEIASDDVFELFQLHDDARIERVDVVDTDLARRHVPFVVFVAVVFVDDVLIRLVVFAEQA